MTDLKVALRITVDGTGQAKVELNNVADAEAKVGREAASATRGLDAMGRSLQETAGGAKRLDTTARSLIGTLGGFSLGALVADLTKTAAELQNVNGRLAFFSNSAGEAEAAQQRLMATAKALNTDYTVLADTYAKLLPLQKAGLITGQQTQDILVGMTNAGKALGAQNAQLGQSFFGLSQALSSPIVRAEELNQVVEPLPGLLQALDRAAHLPAGGFRQMVNEGKVTAEFFATTLVQALREFDGAAARTAGNIDGAAQRMRTAWQETAAAFEKPINFAANRLADFIEVQLANDIGAIKALGAAWNWAKGILGNGLPDDAMAAEYAARNQPPSGPGGFVGPVIDEGTLKQRRDAAEKAAKAQESADRTLTQSKIELLRAQGQEAEALRLEAQLRGLTGQAADDYVSIELRSIEAKAGAKRASEAHAAALKSEAEAQRLIAGLLEKAMDPWQKHAARMAEAEAAMSKIKLTTEQYQAVSRALNEQLEQDVAAWVKNYEAQDENFQAWLKQEEKQKGVIDGLRQEAEALKYAGTEKKVYLNLQKAGVKADSEAGQIIRNLTRDISDQTAAQQAATSAAEAWETAWKRSIENVQDAIANGLYDLMTGQGAQGFLRNLADVAARITANQAGLLLQEVFRGIAGPASGAQTAAGAVGNVFRSAGNAIAGLFGYGTATPSASVRNFTGGWGGAVGQGNARQTALWSAGLGVAAQMMMPQNLYSNGQPAWMRNSTFEGAADLFSVAGDVVGSVIPIFKLLRPAIEFSTRIAGSMYPDRRPSTAGMIIGPAFGIPPAIAARLFGQVVKSSVGYQYSPEGGLNQTYYHTQNGAPVGILQSAGAGLGASLASVSRSLGITIPSFNAAFENRGARMTISGYEPGGEAFYKSSNFRITDINVEGQTKLFLASILKRQDVLKQFDDFLIRSAFSAAQSLEEINRNVKAVAKLRAFEGETGSNANALGEIWSAYNAGMDTLARIAPGGKKRRAEVAKLDAALGRQFDTQVFGFRQTYASATGQPTNDLEASLRQIDTQFRDLAAQNQALADLAKRSKGKLQYTALTADQLAAGQRAAIRNLLIDRTALDQAKQSVKDLLDSFKGIGPTVASLAADIDSGLTALNALTGPDAYTQIAKIADLAKQRFALELSNYSALLSAAQNLKASLDSLKLSNLSPLTPLQRLTEAQGQFGKTLLAAQAGDATAMQNLFGYGQQYLSEARSYYASGADYTRIFDSVMSGLNLAADNVLSGADSGANAIQQRLADTLDKLEKFLAAQPDPASTANTLATAVAAGIDASATKVVTAVDATTKAVRNLGGLLK